MLSQKMQGHIRFLRGQISKRKALKLILGEGEKVRISKRELSRFKLNSHLLNEIYLMGRPSLKNRTAYRDIQKILNDERLIERDGLLPDFRTLTYRGLQKILNDERLIERDGLLPRIHPSPSVPKRLEKKKLIPRDRNSPSIHAIANACRRKGQKYRRQRKSTCGPA